MEPDGPGWARRGFRRPTSWWSRPGRRRARDALGRGGGSYDRALARVPMIVWCSPCCTTASAPVVPAEPHDRPVTAVATPRRGLTGSRDPASGGAAGDLDVLLLVGAVVLLVAIAAVRLSVGSGLPSLLLYLGLGLLLGEDAIGLKFDDKELAQALGFAALVVILAEGGLTTPWRTIRPVVPAAAALATIGTAVSVPSPAARPTCCSTSTGARPSSSARSWRPPTRPPSSRCCAGCRCRPGSAVCWKRSPGSTTRPS